MDLALEGEQAGNELMQRGLTNHVLQTVAGVTSDRYVDIFHHINGPLCT